MRGARQIFREGSDYPGDSAAACVPAMNPCTWPLPRPCFWNPPTASPPTLPPSEAKRSTLRLAHEYEGTVAMSPFNVAIAGACAVLFVGCAVNETIKPPWFDSSLDALVSSRLRKFHSADEFEAYRATLWNLGDRHGAYWARGGGFPTGELMASNEVVAPCDPDVAPCEPSVAPCDPGVASCQVAVPTEEIILTGSRIATPSITNNQELGVDEGDIVKRFDRFLIVLHDGRLFSIDTGTAGVAMALVDRIDVYRSADHDAWYDELLVFDDQLIVTGYSYELGASELSIFRISAGGVFTFLATYYITSDDYYSDDNYATRLVDGNLTLYTPLYLTDFEPDEDVPFPRIRRWTAETGYTEWQPLFVATDVYVPIQRTLDPVVHTISVCPLQTGSDWLCRSTGVIGPWQREFYVSPQHAYVWVSTSEYDAYDWDLDECDEDVMMRDFPALPAALYRIPLSGGPAEAVLTSGTPTDQFALDAREHEFLALLRWVPGGCYLYDDVYALRYVRIPATAFGTRPGRLADAAYVSVPLPRGDGIENRFTERYLVYAGNRSRWGNYGIGHGDYETTDLIALPVDDPGSLSLLPLLHSGERVEVFGDGIVVDGYQSTQGLWVSTIDLRSRPAVADTQYFDRVLESEGRSHAFNALVEPDGSGMFGLPTVFETESDSWDSPSNLHFFTVDERLALRVAGYLAASADAEAQSYECEVSCVDWYGNARPIFMDGRIFALTGTELIEGYLVEGQILERQRVNMTGIPLHPR